MTTLNILLPDPMCAYVEEQAKSSGYAIPDEYVRALIREDQKRKAEKHLEAMLVEGLESGEADVMKSEDWREIRREICARSMGHKDSGR